MKSVQKERLDSLFLFFDSTYGGRARTTPLLSIGYEAPVLIEQASLFCSEGRENGPYVEKPMPEPWQVGDGVSSERTDGDVQPVLSVGDAVGKAQGGSPEFGRVIPADYLL